MTVRRSEGVPSASQLAVLEISQERLDWHNPLVHNNIMADDLHEN